AGDPRLINAVRQASAQVQQFVQTHSESK
ncbi:MAG: hypothetical protein RL302_923, partial [Pseudomonadota bacterium]